jgi:DNA polymerase
MLPGVGSISRVHGQMFERGGVAFVPVYHPAAALHNGSLVSELQRDFDKVREYLDRVLVPPPPPEPAPPSAGSAGTSPPSGEEASQLTLL